MSPVDGDLAGSSVEFERRYIVHDTQVSAQTLLANGFALSATVDLEDRWYAPSAVRDLASHEAWLASGFATPCRLRIVSHAEGKASVLEAKRPRIPGDYSESIEAKVGVDDADAASLFLRSIGLHQIVLLRRMRRVFLSPQHLEVEVVLDSYSDPFRLEIMEIEGAAPEGLIDNLTRGLHVIGDSSVLHFLRRTLPIAALPESP